MRRLLLPVSALVLCACSGGTPAAAPTAPAPVTVTVTATPPAKTTIAAPAKTVTVTYTPTPAEDELIQDGVWVVGDDIKAGTYRTIETVGEDCYWKITRSGTNGDDIINNDIPGGGRPRVTLQKGQDFATRDCGVWERE